MILTIACAVAMVGCTSDDAGLSSANAEADQDKVVTKFTPSPTPGLDERALSELEGIHDRLATQTVSVMMQAGESRGWQAAACEAEANYRDAHRLKTVARDHTLQVAPIVSVSNANAMAMNQLLIYGAIAVKAAQAGPSDLACMASESYGSRSVSDMLYGVAEEFGNANADLSKIGIAPKELRELALKSARKELEDADVYRNLRAKPDAQEDPADEDTLTPLEKARGAWADFHGSDLWDFTFQELGFSDDEKRLLKDQ